MIAGYIATVDASLRACKTTDDKLSYMRGAMKIHAVYATGRQQGKTQLAKQLKSRYDRLINKQKKERGL